MLAGISIVVMLTALAPTLNGLKPDTALGKTLKAQGYVGVPIVQGKWSGWYYLNAKVDDISTTFIIDTGAAHNCLSKELAIELGYKLDESTTRQGPFGQTIHEYGKAIPLLVVGGLEFGQGIFLINDMMTPEATRGDAMPKAGHGLLGAPFLTYFSAVIDYQSNTLYLLDPARRTKPFAWALDGHCWGMARRIISGTLRCFTRHCRCHRNALIQKYSDQIPPSVGCSWPLESPQSDTSWSWCEAGHLQARRQHAYHCRAVVR